jgi:hypothetical protein
MDETGIEVFISSASEDYPSATEVFRHLSSLGVRCFFSEDTLDRLGQTQYKQVIESALEQCRHLILVTSSRVNAEKKWVQHEWQTFDNECLSNRKEGNLVTLACSGLTPAELPWTPRNRIVLRWPAEKERLISYVGRKRTPPPVAVAVPEPARVHAAPAPEPEPAPAASIPQGGKQHTGPAPGIPSTPRPAPVPGAYDLLANWSPAAHRMLLWVLAGTGASAMLDGIIFSLDGDTAGGGAVGLIVGGSFITAALLQGQRVRKMTRFSQTAEQGDSQSPQAPPATKAASLKDYPPRKLLALGLLVVIAGMLMLIVTHGKFLFYSGFPALFALYCLWLAITKWWARRKGRQ